MRSASLPGRRPGEGRDPATCASSKTLGPGLRRGDECGVEVLMNVTGAGIDNVTMGSDRRCEHGRMARGEDVHVLFFGGMRMRSAGLPVRRPGEGRDPVTCVSPKTPVPGLRRGDEWR
jgi:hypothetical protein